MPQTIIVGIDPGIHGAVAVLYENGPAVWDIPIVKDGKKFAIDPHELGHELATLPHGNVHVWVEKVWARQNERPSSAFNFGRAYGTILGLCTALMLRHDLVTPAAWAKELAAPTDDKARIAMAKRLYPTLNGEFELKTKAHHRADALLIAEYGKRKLGI